MIVIMLVTCAVVFVKVILLQLLDNNNAMGCQDMSLYLYLLTRPQHKVWLLILKIWNFDTDFRKEDRYDLVNYPSKFRLKALVEIGTKSEVSSELSIKISQKRNAVAYTVI